jgi:sigma-B regulation protein RsbU (phosphoserine phosphatase)
VHAHWGDTSLAAAASRINRTFYENIPADRYATSFLARLDPMSGRLVYVNAGHPPALLVRANGPAELLSEGGPGIGLFDAAEFQVGMTVMQPGDTLMIYSDGVSESWPTPEAAEGFLVDLMRSYSSVPVGPVCAEVLAAVDRLRGGARSDDCTLIVLRWSPPRR